MHILILGRGYIGSELARQAMARGHTVVQLTHSEFSKIPSCVRAHPQDALINSAAYIPQPSVSLCDRHQKETIQGNILFPLKCSLAAAMSDIPILQISTACLFDDAKDYSETDMPMRGFNDHCGMYVGTKLIAEEIVAGYDKHWIARIRLPFDEQDNPRNYLSKLIKYPQVYDHDNSLCHRGDIVRAMLDMIEIKAPFGLYNLCNTGHVSARSIINKMTNAGIIHGVKEYIPGPCKGTRLSNSKLLAVGVKIRSIEDAIDDSIENWRAV